jgi:hypothetical protein
MFLLNRIPSKFVDKTLYEIWNGKRPIFPHLKNLRCDVYMKHIVSEKAKN